MEWQPIETAPKDGTWILGMNSKGNPAVIIWDAQQNGWIHPFSMGELSTFWNGGAGSVAKYWMPIKWSPEASSAPYWATGK
jgi:hypothetical protein